MLKVLIADDEKNICLMIQKLISWEDFDMEVIGLAHNGLEAVRIIEEDCPDVVISDIRMPGCDGLDIIQRAHDLERSIDFVIISGYKYFEYAHKALNLGVEHYLLKPIDKKELEKVLERISRKRKTEVLKAEEEVKMKEQIHSGHKRIQKHFLSSIMNEKRSPVQNLELNQINQEFQCDFQSGCFVAFFAKLDSEDTSEELSGLLHMLEMMLDEDLKESGNEYINSIMKSGVITIINYSGGITDQSADQIKRLFIQMKKEIDKFNGYHITLGIGNIKNSISEVAGSIQEAIHAVKCRCKAGLDRMIYYDQIRYIEIPLGEILDEKRCREMENIVDVLDFKALYEENRRAINYVSGTAFYSPVSVYNYLEKVSDIVLTGLKKNKVDDDLLNKFEEDMQKVLDFYTDLGEMTYQFSMVIRNYFEKVISEKKNRGQHSIRMARQYIQENYDKQINLDEVAGAIHLSPAYLSHMFKKELGINFSDFLISCRMEAAKELLRTTDLQIAEVAEKVGYTDSRYFSKTFNKIVGLKPSVYRKLYR